MPKIIGHIFEPKGRPGGCAYCGKKTTTFCIHCRTYVCDECSPEHDKRQGLGLQD